jgi:MFS family permease
MALPETHHPGDAPGEHPKHGVLDFRAIGGSFRRPALGELLTVFSVQNFAFALLEATFTWLVLVRFLGFNVRGEPLEAAQEGMAAQLVGPIFGIVGVTVMIVQGAMMGGLARQIGERRLVWVGGLMLAAAMFWIAQTHSMLWLKVASALVAAGSGILNPSLSSLISQVAGAHEKGSVMGVQQSLGSLARMIAPPLGTWLLQRFGAGVPFYTSGVLMILAFALSLRIPPIRREPEPGPLEPLTH